MGDPILTASGLKKQYHFNLQTKTVLTGISFTVAEGEVLSLIGLNGAGKSTLLKLLVGFSKADSGSVTIKGRSVSNPAARREIGFMPENPQFYPDLTGGQFLNYVGQLFTKDKAAVTKKCRQLMRDVGLDQNLHQPIRTYSKGMRQRLGFAQAIINDPKILLLDEPLDGLDPIGRHYLKGELLKLKRAKVTIIICSHILSDLASLSDRIGVIHQGRLSTLQTTKQFIKKQSLETAFVNYLNKL